MIMTETLPAGLLSEIARDLGTTEPAAGQLVSAYALRTIIAAIPATALTRSTRCRPVLLVGIVGFLVANAVAALAPWYLLALAARFVAGAFSGLIWGMIPGYASRIVPEHLRGRAIAMVMVGTPLALSIGTPLGTLAGTVIGWRWTFAAMSLVCVGLIAWVRFGVPDAAGQTLGTRTPLRRVLGIPGLLPIRRRRLDTGAHHALHLRGALPRSRTKRVSLASSGRASQSRPRRGKRLHAARGA